MTGINATELNYIVYRYLTESGFMHAAFNLGYEGGINKETSIDEHSVPPGALVTLVRKGLQYLEMEADLKTDDTDETEDFSFIKPFDLLTKTTNELKQIVEEKRKHKAAMEPEKQSKGKEIVEDKEPVIKDKETETKHDKVNYKLKEKATIAGPRPMDMMSTSSTPRTRGVRSSDVLTLGGHTAEVYACAWSPASLVLASGSEDSTARIWNIADKTNSSSATNRLARVRVLRHSEAKQENRARVTTLDWNLNGTLLATGSNDGLARIWNENGELKSTLSNHQGPIYSVKWNKMGNYLLTGSFDGSAIAWDLNANELNQQFEFHSGHPVFVDWRTNRTFAGSADAMIYVCKIGDNKPVKMFSGHKGEINCVQWDPSGSLLASCSDDTTTKVWSLSQDIPIHDFKDHAQEIYTIRWSPTGLKTNNPNNHLLLASASSDSTVKLWDVESGGLFCSLNGHRDAVYCLAFSPNGEYLASGSQDKLMNIWSVKDGKIVKTYFGNGCISGISWNKGGNKIAYCTHNKIVCVSDFRV